MKLINPKTLSILLFSLLALSACKSEKKEAVEVEKIPGINLQFMDTTARPQDDFFRYVNGKWLDQTEIPADKTSWGSFNELREKTDADVLAILNEALKSNTYPAASDQGKALNLYRSILDSTARNEQGIKPLEQNLKQIDAIKNVKDLEAYFIENEPKGSGGLFGVNIFSDAKDSNKNVVYLGVGGLGLPDREYYVSNDADPKEKREKYVAHVAKMLQYLGQDAESAGKDAQAVLAFETSLATPMFTRVERRDDRLSYNPMKVSDLQKLTPTINWENYLDGIGIKALDTIVVTEPKYMAALQTMLKKGDLNSWKAYLKWSLLRGASGTLSDDIETANWEFYGKTLRGAQAQEPRDKRALQTVNRRMGEAVGKIYVDKKFPPEAKQKAEELIANLIAAYDTRIKALPWMSEETKTKALEKLHKLRIKIAYPDKWKDYSKLTINGPETGSYYENSRNLSQWNFSKDLEKIGKPVDKDEWFMAPQIVNAYFNPSFNEIVFPAAILQPPFYNYTADAAVNYGGIGAVIGHEISHGFDDSGARYDANGNLVDWWTADDLKQFTELGNALADQYSKLEPLPEIFVDGKFTLGENIGDLGGVNAAFDALQLDLAKNGNPEKIDGFTPEQRFFLSWATVWRTKTRDEALKTQVKTDPHAPGMYRAIVPIQNVDVFYKAFDIKEGDKLFLTPEQRVKIW
ncbi:MAG: M13 family peptidase [Flavobacteriales bacterium CG_4_9_14_3_um_filter_40_17]|nr:MAG: M13 family peptidase [Flavobacteriales bacterium CG_4_9_14_3_um_filter_40_17]